MARSFFNPESTPWKLLGYFGDFLMLSLIWALCSFPLITLGAATTALYDTVVHCVRRNESGMFSRYFQTFKAEFVPATLSTLLWAAVLALLFYLRALLAQATGLQGAGGVLSMALLVLLLIPVGMACWVFPVLSRFTLGFGALNGNTVRLALGNILRTLALGVLTLASAVLCARLILPLMFFPAIVALLWSYLLEPVFSKYSKRDE